MACVSVSKTAAGISTMFRSDAEVEKACAVQKWRRTAASASETVAAGLTYHAARPGWTWPLAARLLAQSVYRENNASRRGVVRAMDR